MTEIDNLKIKVEMPDGMTLRDYFAGQFISNSNARGDRADLAEHAYLYADAMLEARK